MTREAFQETIMIDPTDIAVVKHHPSFTQTRHIADNFNPSMKNRGGATGDTEHDGRPQLPNYFATRLSTVLLVRRTGEVLFVERDVWFSGTDAKPELATYQDGRHERKFRFQIQCEITCKYISHPYLFHLRQMRHYALTVLHPTGLRTHQRLDTTRLGSSFPVRQVEW